MLTGWTFSSRCDESRVAGPDGIDGSALRSTDSAPGVTGARANIVAFAYTPDVAMASSAYFRVSGGLSGVRFVRSTVSGYIVDFNFSDNTYVVAAGSILSAGMVDIGGGWRRCWVVGTNVGTSMSTAFYYLKDGITSWTGTGIETGDMFLPQAEIGAYPTSPIRTSGTTQQRGADVLTVPNPLVNGDSWAISVNVRAAGVWTSIGLSNYVWALGEVGTPNSASLHLVHTNTLIFVVYDANGAVRRKQWSITYDMSSSHHLIAGFDGTELFIMSDGVAVGALDATTGTGIISAMPSTLYIGSSSAASSTFGGYINNVKVSRTANLLRANL